MKRLENKVAVVTGASTGIGQASAIALAQEGAYVLAVDIAEAVSETVDKIKSNGDKAKAYVVDIASEQQIDNFASEIREQFGHVDVLFNNAGVDNAAGRIHEYPTDVYDKIMNVDMRGTFLMTKSLA
ncbi:KR domain protein, partial [Staphylococcus aureus subsp. aureus IS-160]